MTSRIFVICLLVLTFSCAKELKDNNPKEVHISHENGNNPISSNEITEKLRNFKSNYIEFILSKADYKQNQYLESKLSVFENINSESGDVLKRLDSMVNLGAEISYNAVDDFSRYGHFKVYGKDEYNWEPDVICSSGYLPKITKNEKGVLSFGRHTIDPLIYEDCHSELRKNREIIESINSYQKLMQAKSSFKFALGMQMKSKSENALLNWK